MEREQKETIMARKSTPWGPAQHTAVIAPGIVSYSTAGHGGIWLDARHEEMRKERFPSFRPFTSDQWYEEDQDWAIVALTFPQFFDAQDLRAAIRTADYSAKFDTQPGRVASEHRGWQDVHNWVQSNAWPAQQIRQQVGKWIRDNAANWERGSSGSAPAGYSYPQSWCEYIRIGDGARMSIVENQHDWKKVYTDEDIAGFRVATIKHYGQELVSA